MENESFFKQYFENNNFGFPFDIGKEIRIKFFENFIDYFKNDNSEETKHKLFNLCGKSDVDDIMFTFDCYWDVYGILKNGIIQGSDYEGD